VPHPNDTHHMQVALRLAARHVGITSQAPSVGCVIVKDHRIVGMGVTSSGGQPHAEIAALAQAGNHAKHATAYVTLEPCCHQGTRQHCTDALIEAGIANVVIAVLDPHPDVNGQGRNLLHAQGITVEVGLLAQQAQTQMQGYFSRQTKHRPFVTAKIATSWDGAIAMHTGESQWISGPEERDYSHYLRFRHNAIMVGSGTVIHDNPSLTCRLKGLEAHSPQRIIIDKHLETPLSSILVQSAHTTATTIITAQPSHHAPYVKQGVHIHVMGLDSTGHFSLPQLLTYLASQGINTLLIEGGASLLTSFIKAKLVDELIWSKHHSALGAGQKQALESLDLSALKDRLLLNKKEQFQAGDDLVTRFTL
jgi:diaminohydroxyphosphoribosylaminopyrimidine deaminase/5-amino-6-(5-phosphoribosylamino)uracil reductase